jgi:anti-sigma B factor antagonist
VIREKPSDIGGILARNGSPVWFTDGAGSLRCCGMQYRPDSGHQDLIEIGTADVDGLLVVTVSGEVDVYSSSQLQVALREAVGGSDARPVTVDLTAVTFFSSTGCAVLVEALRQAQRRGRSFVLVVDRTSRPVSLTLHAAGLVGLFTLYDDVEAARRGLTS